jgi:hypothetical protein
MLFNHCRSGCRPALKTLPDHAVHQRLSAGKVIGRGGHIMSQNNQTVIRKFPQLTPDGTRGIKALTRM